MLAPSLGKGPPALAARFQLRKSGRRLGIAVLLALLPATVWSADTGFAATAAEAALAGAPDVLETVWSSSRPPFQAHDRIGLHRYRAKGPSRAVLLYLPGTNMNGVAALTDDAHNLCIFLARRGVEVFAVDYRTHAVPAAGVADLGFMRGWTLQAFVDDARAAAQKAREESGQARLFVAGFSRGVSIAYAYAAGDASAVSGLIALDGAFKSHAPKQAYDAAAELRKLEASGAWASDVAGRMGWDARQKLMQAAAADPGGPASDPKFATIGEQLGQILFTAWRPGGLANAREGLSRPEVLARLLAGYDRYYPAIQDVAGRSIADHDDDPGTPLDDGWGRMQTPILNFTSTGMGGDWLLNSIYSADKSGSGDVTLNVLERYGHLDVIVGERARAEVFEPVLAWTLSRSKP